MMSELINTTWAGYFPALPGHFGGLAGASLISAVAVFSGLFVRLPVGVLSVGLIRRALSSGMGPVFQFPKSVVQASEPVVLLVQPVVYVVVDAGFDAVAVALHPVGLVAGERWRHVHFQVGEALPDGLFNSLGVEICGLFPYEIKKTWSTTTRT